MKLEIVKKAKKKKSFVSGFRVTINTMTGDADNYHKIVYNGLTETEAVSLIALLKDCPEYGDEVEEYLDKINKEYRKLPEDSRETSALRFLTYGEWYIDEYGIYDSYDEYEVIYIDNDGNKFDVKETE